MGYKNTGDRYHWEDGKKVCPVCERKLEPSEYEEDQLRWDGVSRLCRRCMELGKGESKRLAMEEREVSRKREFKEEQSEMMRVTMEMKRRKDGDQD